MQSLQMYIQFLIALHKLSRTAVEMPLRWPCRNFMGDVVSPSEHQILFVEVLVCNSQWLQHVSSTRDKKMKKRNSVFLAECHLAFCTFLSCDVVNAEWFNRDVTLLFVHIAHIVSIRERRKRFHNIQRIQSTWPSGLLMGPSLQECWPGLCVNILLQVGQAEPETYREPGSTTEPILMFLWQKLGYRKKHDSALPSSCQTILTDSLSRVFLLILAHKGKTVALALKLRKDLLNFWPSIYMCSGYVNGSVFLESIHPNFDWKLI